jgi:hypothetical protein
LDWFEVTQVRGQIVDGEIAQFQVGLKVGFRLEDGRPPPGAAGQLAGVSRSRRTMICEVLMDQILATGKLLTTRQPSAA